MSRHNFYSRSVPRALGSQGRCIRVLSRHRHLTLSRLLPGSPPPPCGRIQRSSEECQTVSIGGDTDHDLISFFLFPSLLVRWVDIHFGSRPRLCASLSSAARFSIDSSQLAPAQPLEACEYLFRFCVCFLGGGGGGVLLHPVYFALFGARYSSRCIVIGEAYTRRMP